MPHSQPVREIKKIAFGLITRLHCAVKQCGINIVVRTSAALLVRWIYLSHLGFQRQGFGRRFVTVPEQKF